jgi:L-cysteine desulfidase
MNRDYTVRKKIINAAMGNRLRRMIHNLSQEDEYYFQLSEEEKTIVANRMKILVIDEIVKLVNGIDNDNIRFIMDVAVENLTIIRTFFESVEMYSQCMMINDTIKQLENDIQELDTIKL